MRRLFFTLIFIFGAAFAPAQAQDISALAAQGPGQNLISDAAGSQMVSAWGASIARPGNIRGSYLWSAATMKALLATPGAAEVRFHLALNSSCDFTIHPEVLDANGNSLAWGPVDVASGISITAATAQANSASWAATKMKPINAPNSLTYPASAFAWLLSLPGAAQLRLSPGINNSGNLTLVGQALDASGTPITTSNAIATIDGGTPCPPAC